MRLQHSAKGSTWESHKYIKRVNGTYYYPDSYEGGRHLPSGESGGSDHSEYTDGDSDFDEKNYDDKNRLGDTDFFGFQRPDGTYVILEEDMKWVLPKGTSITPELISRLEDFDKNIEKMRQEGKTNYTNENWKQWAKEAIDGKTASSSSGGGLSTKDVENLAKEVIRGNFGNGAQRKELLGEDYKQIQDKVNAILKGSKTSEKKEDDSKKKSSAKHDGLHDGSAELEHHGRLHQKWGVKNGPPYPLDSSVTKGYASKQEKRKPITEDQLNKAKTGVENARTIVKETSNITDSVHTMKLAVQPMELEKMSDQELRERVNRLNLEQQYSALTAAQKSRGEAYLKSTLDIAGSTLAIGASALTIAVAIKKLKG